MISKLLAKVLGTKNEREIKRLRSTIGRVNALEENFIPLSDLELTAKTNEFRQRHENGENLDSILPEAFALVRETARRTLNMRHFDVQIMGGATLHQGKIAEMKTGEGKTLVATLPLYLNALSGTGAHLVTVNDYLARRDAEWMKPVYNHLGLEVGILQNNMGDADRKKIYNADIVYGTNNEYGFDYLRDNMKFDLDEYVQKKLSYAIVDEVDSILIDEARTPLIISGPAQKGSDLYGVANRVVVQLNTEKHFEVDEKSRGVHLTEDGHDIVEKLLGIKNLYAPENLLILHHIGQALKAHSLFRRDVDYVVKDGEVLIVDEFTGRILPGRRYSDGLHQALETKEAVRVERENQTLATITLQNYFRLYDKLAGMTGTALTEAQEFYNIYKLDVVAIPTHKPMIRDDQSDAIFLDLEDKFEAIVEDIRTCHEKGQPILVGTIAIETSEYLSGLLSKEGLPHNVLNAKQHQREADIVAEAGEKGRITIATNMAGRGTDIKLTKETLSLGGLRIIGTERHESRRIDNQLRGRAGRQGDRGSSKFYISLEDNLMRIFGGDRLKRIMQRVGMEKGERIEHKLVSKQMENAQERVEKQNFEMRKHLIEYDDVLNQQRGVIYAYRREILEGKDAVLSFIKEVIYDLTEQLVSLHCPQEQCPTDGPAAILDSLVKLTGLEQMAFEQSSLTFSKSSALKEQVAEILIFEYEKLRGSLPEEVRDNAEKWILLQTIDEAWKQHLLTMDKLKEGIHLRGYGQKNPLVEYKRESFFAFETMMSTIKSDIVHHIFRFRPEHFSEKQIDIIEEKKKEELRAAQASHSETSTESSRPLVRRNEDKIGRNNPCPCNSGKKYKKCCGS